MQRAGRLTSSSDFRRVYAEGRRASSAAVISHVLVTAEARPARIGVSAAKGLGGAVERNRAKRVLREAIRLISRPIRPGADAVVVATPRAKDHPFQDLVHSIESTLGRAGAFDA